MTWGFQYFELYFAILFKFGLNCEICTFCDLYLSSEYCSLSGVRELPRLLQADYPVLINQNCLRFQQIAKFMPR